MIKLPRIVIFDHIHRMTLGKRVNRQDQHQLTELRTEDPLISIRQSTIGKERLWYMVAAVIVMLVIMCTRLAELQIVRGEQYLGMADKNRMVKKTITAPRGIIKDRAGEIIAFNKPYVEMDDKRLTFDEALKTADFSNEQIVAIRQYACGVACSSIVGYTSQITQEELERHRLTSQSPISVKDQRGRGGLEESYDNLLKGTNGYIEYEVSAKGTIQKEITTVQPEPGFSIITTIDKKLQQFAYDTLAKKVQEVGGEGGSVVVQNPQTGEVLALVTYPTFDNNIFTNQTADGNITQLFNDTRTPLLNRAIAGQYPPGSTYKIVSSAAVLQEKVMNREQTISDTGKIELSGTTFNNWYYTSYGKTDGDVDVVEALKRSNDIYYYRTSLLLGIEKLEEWSRIFGLGVQSGIDIPGEANGLVPNPRWKEEVKKEQWFPGNTVNMSIGQGDLLATPVQVNTYLNVIANKGILVVPQVVKEVHDANGKSLCQRDQGTGLWKGESCESLNAQQKTNKQIILSKETIRAIEEGLIQANSRGGTATPFFNYTIKTAGKTGTSESIPGRPPHAWYSVYAPLEDPKISVTVVVEFGGQGSSVAAPIAKDILDYYFF